MCQATASIHKSEGPHLSVVLSLPITLGPEQDLQTVRTGGDKSSNRMLEIALKVKQNVGIRVYLSLFEPLISTSEGHLIPGGKPAPTSALARPNRLPLTAEVHRRPDVQRNYFPKNFDSTVYANAIVLNAPRTLKNQFSQTRLAIPFMSVHSFKAARLNL
jgi:hypothetical protein